MENLSKEQLSILTQIIREGYSLTPSYDVSTDEIHYVVGHVPKTSYIRLYATLDCFIAKSRYNREKTVESLEEFETEVKYWIDRYGRN